MTKAKRHQILFFGKIRKSRHRHELRNIVKVIHGKKTMFLALASCYQEIVTFSTIPLLYKYNFLIICYCYEYECQQIRNQFIV